MCLLLSSIFGSHSFKSNFRSGFFEKIEDQKDDEDDSSFAGSGDDGGSDNVDNERLLIFGVVASEREGR